jgi:hypothetical protein
MFHWTQRHPFIPLSPVVHNLILPSLDLDSAFVAADTVLFLLLAPSRRGPER